MYRNLIFRKQSCYFVFNIVAIILIPISLLIIVFYQYNPYYIVNGLYNEKDNTVSLIVDSNKLESISDSEIIIENQLIDRNDLVVGNFITANNKIYNSVAIYLNNDINKKIVNVSFKFKKTTLFKEIKKGMMK